ncbi:MAG: ATP-binding protein [Opitutales bacterium]
MSDPERSSATTSLFLAATWTELRRREDQLRSNEERLRAFVQALPDPALVFDADGICTKFSPQSTVTSGIGIPGEHRGELFRTFKQVDSSTTSEYGGTGLGLSIVQRLVDIMGAGFPWRARSVKDRSFVFSSSWNRYGKRSVPPRRNGPRSCWTVPLRTSSP